MADQKSPSLARAVALDLLEAVLRRGRPLDDAIPDHPGFAGLEVRDRAFARLLTATTLRRLGQIDAVIDAALERPLPRKTQGVRDILRLGTVQLLFLDTPPHAAVATAVDLAQARKHGPHKKLVNAVLRRLGRQGRALAEAQDAPRLNTPDWLWEAWVKAYGEPTCRRIAEAHLSQAPLDFTVKGDAARWAKELDARILPTGSLRRPPGGTVTDLPGFREGAWWVQDAAAALPVNLLGDIKGRSVIDLCAAPGGKTAQLANRGAVVTAVDRSEKRLARLSENLRRLGLTAELITADATTWRPPQLAEMVLVDVPCSATGTIRRHPDVARLKKPDDVAKLTGVQDRLLTAALEMTAPGGTVVYCSCSLLPQEGPERIEPLIGAGGAARREPVKPGETGGMKELISAEGDLRTLPCHLPEQGGMDGFYAARLIKA
ncbi:MAG: MFS transporter [Proteobacteria bacterium]|nr:MFS transporter [Pseudomonadota bacterium]